MSRIVVYVASVAVAVFLVGEVHAQPCTGDCDENAEVALDEVIACVGIVLGSTPLAQCAACDASGDTAVDITELVAAVNGTLGSCDPPSPRDVQFEKTTLHREFQCEGATFGDFDRDGVTDVVLGPDWYRGPDYAERYALWARAVPPFDVRDYSDCFFQFTHDFDADGWLDVLVVGFPGQSASWLENPGKRGASWEQHIVVTTVENESPVFTDLTGDGEPELVHMAGGRFGYSTPDPADPTLAWVFHPISEPRGFGPFIHGLGVGDVDGDGRLDVLEATGYFLQPPSLDGDPPWRREEQLFGTAGTGGAQIVTTDVDRDGDADVITTLDAHGYGFAWYEQNAPGVLPLFTEHVVVPDAMPALNAPVILHEPHALALADVDGDRVPDVVTGERHWAHPPAVGVPFETPARIYWFRLVRDGKAPAFEAHLIDDDSGVGTQVTVGDVSGDDLPDVVVANKKGAFVFRQRSSDEAR